MADNFNFLKFIKNNPLLKESIGGYKDISPLGEEEDLAGKTENLRGMYKDEGTGLMTYWGTKPSGDPAILVRKNGKLLSPDDQEALSDKEFNILSQLKQKTWLFPESQNEAKDADDVKEGADFTRFYKVGAKYDNSDNPIGGFKEYTIVSVDPENQTVTVKGANGVKTFDAWEFGNDFMPARSKEAQWQDKYGPGADRFN